MNKNSGVYSVMILEIHRSPLKVNVWVNEVTIV
jgi:hypothetical protein